MRLLKIKIAVNEVEQSYQVVCDGGALKASTLARVDVRLYKGEDPVTNKGLVLLAEKGVLAMFLVSSSDKGGWTFGMAI